MSTLPPFLRIKRELSPIETWGFGFTGLLSWLFVAPDAHDALGTQALTLWVCATAAGIFINLQVQRMGMHWPEMAGGTPNYTARLLRDYPWLARYAAMGYFMGWSSLPTLSALLLVEVLDPYLRAAGLDIPKLPLQVAFTVVGFVVAFSGTRNLSTLHLFFIIPALGLLLTFGLHGLVWLGSAPHSPGLWPSAWNEVSAVTWAQWFFLATYTAYGGEIASSFAADSRAPRATLRCLSVAACLMLPIFIGGSWILTQLAAGSAAPGSNDVSHLLSAAAPFWGGTASFIITFLIAATCLLSSATGAANSPRVLYQLALDGHVAPVFGVVSRRSVPGPALVFTLLISLAYLLAGNLTDILVVSGTGYFFCFIAMHLGQWLQRGQPEVRWPRWSLALFIIEALIFIIGGLAWGWAAFLAGLLAPALVLGIAFGIRHARLAPLTVDWWVYHYYGRRYRAPSDSMLVHITTILVLMCAATATAWLLSDRVGGFKASEIGPNLFAIILLVVSFLGVAVASWTSISQSKALSEARAEIEHLLNSAQDAIMLADEHGIIYSVNAVAAQLFATKQLAGRRIQELLPALSNDHGFNPAHLPRRMEFTITPPHNKPTTVEATFSSQSAGDTPSVIIIMRNITERKHAEQTLQDFTNRLERSNRELQDFAAVASHDLQEPLRKIQAFSDRLTTQYKSQLSAEVRDYLERMHNAAARMQNLINDLLAFSRVTSKAQPFVTVNLNEAVREVLSNLEVGITQTGARIELDELPTLEAEPTQMRQLLQNLISNALKFRQPGTTPIIKIYGRLLDKFIPPGAPSAMPRHYGEICVQDNGIGFDEKYLHRIFTIFQRLHGRGEYEGSGIGLAICRKIVEYHGGTIAAKSSPGQGATFIVTLPARHT